MSSIAVVYALFPDTDTARRIAKTLVSERLIACANILSNCTSVYEWRGKAEEKSETPALLKTGREKAEALIKRLAELHPYEIPAILCWRDVDAHSPFADWVVEQLES